VQIQQAIDLATILGGEVYLKPGTYNTTATINLKSNVTLTGAGRGKTIISGAATTYTMVNTIRFGITKTLYNNILVRGITFTSNADAIIEINNTNSVQFTGCEWKYTVTTPVSQSFNFQYCQNVQVNGNYLHNFTGNGIQINACDYFAVANNICNGVVAVDSEGINVDIDFMLTKTIISRFGTVTGNVIDNCVNGIRVENGHNIIVNGNTINGSGDSGIYLNTSDGLALDFITVVNNNISDTVYSGIAVVGDDVSGILINGNNIDSSGQVGGANVRAGINVNSPNVQVTNNNLIGCGGNDANGGAIVLYKKSPVFVANNYIQDSTFGIRVWNGSASEVYTGVRIENNKMQNNGTNYVDAITQDGVIIVSETTNAALDISSKTKGFAPPRMTTTQRNAIASPTAGLMIYNTTTNKLNVYTTTWEAITSA
jgi:parallel beta-helix repeat protein